MDDQEKGDIYNSDDRLFLQSNNIDFIFRIEETGALSTLLSIVMGRDIGQDDKFNDYLRIKQERPQT